MAKTIEIDGKYYNEGVEVSAPKKKTQSKASKKAPKKNIRNDKNVLNDAWDEAKARKAKFGRS